MCPHPSSWDALGRRGKMVPVHRCPMAWTWALVNSQQYASFFHLWGCRYWGASCHNIGQRGCVSRWWSCLMVQLFPEGLQRSLHKRRSHGADPSSIAAISGKSLPGSPCSMSLGPELASSQTWPSVHYPGFWLYAWLWVLEPELLTYFSIQNSFPYLPVSQSHCHSQKTTCVPPLPGSLPNFSFYLCSYSRSASRTPQQLWLKPGKPRIRH